MDSLAEVGCVLKVNMDCEACKMKLLEVLRSISGVYSVTLDAEEGVAKISGEMDPNILLWALAKNGKHAELKWVNLTGPAPKRGYYSNHSSYSSHGHNRYNGYGAIDYPHRRFPERRYYDTHQMYNPHRREYPSYDSSNYGYLPQYNAHYNHEEYQNGTLY